MIRTGLGDFHAEIIHLAGLADVGLFDEGDSRHGAERDISERRFQRESRVVGHVIHAVTVDETVTPRENRKRLVETVFLCRFDDFPAGKPTDKLIPDLVKNDFVGAFLPHDFPLHTVVDGRGSVGGYGAL